MQEKTEANDSESFTQEVRRFVHEARNDLNVISMGIQSLLAAKERPQEIEELISIVQEMGIQRMRERIDWLSEQRIKHDAARKPEQEKSFADTTPPANDSRPANRS